MCRYPTQQIVQPIDKITFRHKENNLVVGNSYNHFGYDGYDSHITIQKYLLKKDQRNNNIR